MTKKIIIDPGHGGRDPGGGTNRYWKEKDMVLKISKYQYNILKNLGVDVKLTRDSDTYLNPEKRTSIVRNSGTDICISNHLNAGGGDGVETIHSIYSNGKLARLIANEIVEEGQNLRRVFTKKHPRLKGKDYYYMHRLTGRVETIIIEYGFADSKGDDVSQIKNNWKRYAEAAVEGICKYIGVEYKASHNERNYMKLGDSGFKVQDFQKGLMELGFVFEYKGKRFGADGHYGNATRSTVIEFQRKYGLDIDGYAGPKTQGKLSELLKAKKDKENEDNKAYRVQVGYFHNKHKAEDLIEELENDGYSTYLKSENKEIE
ncbi:N-acetylmuramoyl-L-alanine amidase [Senegalia massiliensis]|uniref:N-acetylmuramoyl-L-alanine amidase n=1 Tax=Senegalia massiliensis TaxID=1720316 RepID=UPI0010321A2E|nr:N-acetylmuramoyl-L-alanine amidase [Senegalia massiliensis]